MKTVGISFILKCVDPLKLRLMVISVVLLLLAPHSMLLAWPQLVKSDARSNSKISDGQILFSPMDSAMTYLIDRNGTINHTWSSDYLPGEAVYWLGDGTILRSIKTDNAGYGGSGGGVQKVQSDGTLLWDFRYDTNENLSHHDIKMLPSGDVLLIAWEIKTRDEAIAAGRDPDHILGDIFLPDKIVEVKPTGPTTGDIVWEWHAWDHLIQDYDASKDNYGVVGNHPELIDINVGDVFLGMPDWLHSNSIDYNPQFDQILLSVHNFNEIWVIDHSTTTQEAAGHTGGQSGKGGDLLYRWGNPQAYDRGTSNDQIFYGQHDATWIKLGFPGEGDILVFNNGLFRPDGMYSTVEEIIPPVNDNGSYYLENGSAYGPTEPTWIYIANPPTSFYSAEFSGAQRLADGDTMICDGIAGRFFEVTPGGETVWEYTNPYPPQNQKWVFKIDYIAGPPQPPQNNTPDLECNGSLSWSDIKPGATVHGSFQVQNVGDPGSLLNWTVDSSNLTWGTWTFTPSSGEDLTPEQGFVTVQVYVVVPNEKNTEFNGALRVLNQDNASDFVMIPVTLTTSASTALSTARPFLMMVWRWWSLLTEFLGRIGHGFFLAYDMMQRLFLHV